MSDPPESPYPDYEERIRPYGRLMILLRFLYFACGLCLGWLIWG